ncbi:Hypothetical predicted protein [Mytilus galloprovincialis]|uniref:C2H2-type domain-containing protein n=1 Tax=Mytilus galloprovincialis TaxID=29158 RepID=A0A8B6GK86_MYTGA|nr:Hypothetical predicted protein [Mytilus galloprovincialis]
MSNSSYICDVCQENYTSKSSLKRHLNLHNQQTYDCDKSNAKFTRADSLLNHDRRIHLKKKRKSEQPNNFGGKYVQDGQIPSGSGQYTTPSLFFQRAFSYEKKQLKMQSGEPLEDYWTSFKGFPWGSIRQPGPGQMGVA